MTTKALKIKGTQVSFMSFTDIEQLLSGTSTGETPVGWNFKIRGSSIYWVDNNGAERYKTGTLTGNARAFGSIKIIGVDLYYGDEDGNERYAGAINYTVINSTTLGNYSAASSGTFRCAVKDSTGRIWVAFYSDPETKVMISYSDDDGASWTEELVWDGSLQLYYDMVCLVVDSSDVPHLMFIRSTARSILYTYRTGEATWSTPEVIYNMPAGGGRYLLGLAACIDSNNDIHLCSSDSWYAGNIIYWKRDYATSTWGAMEYVSYDDSTNLHIFVDSNDVPYIGVRGGGLYNKLGGSWSAKEDCTAGATSNGQYDCTWAIDSNDKIHLAYECYPPVGSNYTGAIGHICGTPGNWGSEFLVAQCGDDANSIYLYYTCPALVIDNENNAYVIYQYDSYDLQEYSLIRTVWFRKRQSGGGWEAEATMTSDIHHPGTGIYDFYSVMAGLWACNPSSSILDPADCPMAILLNEHRTQLIAHTTHDDAEEVDNSNRIIGQTFIMPLDFDDTNCQLKIKLPLYRVGSQLYPNLVEFTMYACDVDHKPTGLSVYHSEMGDLNADLLDTDTGGAWIWINLAAQRAVTLGNEYVLLMECYYLDPTPGSNKVGWRKDTGAGYSDGGFIYSDDGGSSWNTDEYDNQDLAFELWEVNLFGAEVCFSRGEE